MYVLCVHVCAMYIYIYINMCVLCVSDDGNVERLLWLCNVYFHVCHQNVSDCKLLVETIWTHIRTQTGWAPHVHITAFTVLASFIHCNTYTHTHTHTQSTTYTHKPHIHIHTAHTHTYTHTQSTHTYTHKAHTHTHTHKHTQTTHTSTSIKTKGQDETRCVCVLC